MKKIVFVLLILVLVGCSNTKEGKQNKLDSILSKNNYIIVDVRTKEEYDTGHVKGSINIPYDVIDKSSLDKTKTILVYCKSGARSKKAYDTLTNLNYDVYDLGSYSNITLEKE